MIKPNVMLVAVLSALPLTIGADAAQPVASGIALQGCLRAERVRPNDPSDTRVSYTIETTSTGSRELAERTGSSAKPASSSSAKNTVQLSGSSDTNLQDFVGREVQLTGELLMPPGLPPAAEARATPLPGDATGTFKVTAVKVLKDRCQ